jgi:hypothetical protein
MVLICLMIPHPLFPFRLVLTLISIIDSLSSFFPIGRLGDVCPSDYIFIGAAHIPLPLAYIFLINITFIYIEYLHLTSILASNLLPIILPTTLQPGFLAVVPPPPLSSASSPFSPPPSVRLNSHNPSKIRQTMIEPIGLIWERLNVLSVPLSPSSFLSFCLKRGFQIGPIFPQSKFNG